MTHHWSRRDFVRFLGGASLSLTSGSKASSMASNFVPLSPKSQRPLDEIELAKGLTSSILIRWGDPINEKGDHFGINNDYIGLMLQDKSSALMWVNHESPDPYVLHGGQVPTKKNQGDIIKERMSVGGSLFGLRRDPTKNQWSIDFKNPLNKRFDAQTIIPFAPHKILDSGFARGTLGNCAGGMTPWGSFLTCEENTDDYYGSVHFNGNDRTVEPKAAVFGWTEYFKEPPEHFGWVVEVMPKTGTARKLTSLGRFAHEGACVTRSEKGQIVVYMGDDTNDQCLYKFISKSTESHPDALLEGTLYVAQIPEGRWIPLDRKQNPVLKQKFSRDEDLLVRTREASALVGGTPLDRPEGVAIHPKTKAVYVALTNNIPQKRPYGSILRLDEEGGDMGALRFKASQFLMGDGNQGLACPDNIIFDESGNLWATTDISGSSLGKGVYKNFASNGLYLIPTTGKQAGKPLCMARAPLGAEFTGPMFTPDFKTLFLSVQHPGEGLSKSGQWGSHWPDGKGAVPRSSVLQISLS